MKITDILKISLLVLLAGSCKETTTKAEAAQYEELGAFSADSAYEYVARQVAFGPRVPGSTAHEQCRLWIVETLKMLGADTIEIVGEPVTAWDGKTLPVRNIRARFNGNTDSAPILLAAHYDSRPWADNEDDETLRSTPIDGANDGASGVGVILEIARNLGQQPANVPVEILLTDVEDYGASEVDGSWCLGSQQFARSFSYPMTPRFGILLDMVGGKDAVFPREYFSVQIAPLAVQKIWNMAGNLGLRSRFPRAIGGAITDDHLPLSAAGIPTADIIESDNRLTGSFPDYWHTHGDNISIIDKATLSDVGRVVLNVVYNEK